MNQKISFIIGSIGGLIGLAVGLWAPFVLKLPKEFNFYFLASIAVIVGILLLLLIYYFIFVLGGVFRFISALIIFSFLHMAQGFVALLENFDTGGKLELIKPYLEFDLFVIMPIAFAIGFIPLLFSSIHSSYVNIFLKEKIIKNGYNGKAKILSIEETNIRINKRWVYKLELEIESNYFGKYNHSIQGPMTNLSIQNLKPGETLDVKISKNNKKRIFII